ncbi:MAG: DUF4920 domain-containing protein [Chitinophagaceae bacterium]
MKKVFFASALFLLAVTVKAQITPAAPGVMYGKVSDEGTALQVDKLEANLKDNKFEGKITGKVKEVCQAEGCWIRLEKKDGTTMLVRAKNHSFLMPTNLVGMAVVVEGEAEVKEISEAQRKHYAEDAGKSKKEIDQIKGSEKQVVFQAWGVKVL